MEDVAAIPRPADSLILAHARGRPVATADTRLLLVPGALGGCFPESAIRRGSTLAISSARGGVSLALALAAAVTGVDAWVAAVGLPSLGLLAGAELGVRLERLAVVRAPGDRWPVVAAALVDGMDLLLLGSPGRVRPGDARRLAARAREQGTVLVVARVARGPVLARGARSSPGGRPRQLGGAGQRSWPPPVSPAGSGDHRTPGRCPGAPHDPLVAGSGWPGRPTGPPG